ncbi:MAG: gamma-glutamyl-gamma-aminobutyrate hydrolase family protein [Thermostichales cyanobacterium SZTDM-1c_bins_54]
MKVWIGITTYERHPEHGWTLPAAYVDAVRAAGGIPVLLPPGQRDPEVWLERLDGLILAGGIDLSPGCYGADPHPKTEEPNPERDATELALVQRLLTWSHPVLGICRGMQVLNVGLGGSLIQHLPEWGEGVAHRSEAGDPIVHGVRVELGSRLGESYGVGELEVVSWHHQGVERLGEGLRAVSWAADGLIEAVEHREHPWLVGVQWHPEMSPVGDAYQGRLFAALVQQAWAARLGQLGGDR